MHLRPNRISFLLTAIVGIAATLPAATAPAAWAPPSARPATARAATQESRFSCNSKGLNFQASYSSTCRNATKQRDELITDLLKRYMIGERK